MVARIALGALAVVATVAAVAFAALYFTNGSDGVSTAAGACDDRVYGHIASLVPHGGAYRLRLDPAWFTTGVTANVAAAEDGVVAPGEPVPNDNYRVEEGHHLLTYVVPADAHVTVLTRDGDPAGFGSTPVTVQELARLLAGEPAVELFEPLDTGVWIRLRGDTTCAIDQQYLP